MSHSADLVRAALRATTAVPPLRGALRWASRADILPGWLWKRLPVQTHFTLLYPDNLTFEYASTAYDAIGRQLFWKGETWWEYESTILFARLAKSALNTLDIGANTGMYTLIAAAAHPEAKVLAFEPVPRLRARLEANIETNGFGGRCRVSRCAVSDTPGQTQFHVPDEEMPTSASLNPDGFRGIPGVLIDIEVTTADTAAAQAGLRPIDLVKIDVEGFEDCVLRGMEEILSQDRPIVLFECNADGPAETLEACFHGHGYALFHLAENGPMAVDAILPDSRGTLRNFLAIPPEKRDWL